MYEEMWESIVLGVVGLLVSAYIIKKIYRAFSSGGIDACNCSSCPISNNCSEKTN